MSLKAPLTIRARFFRVYLLVGLVAVVFVTGAIGITDYLRIRHLLVEEFQYKAAMAGKLYADAHITHTHLPFNALAALGIHPNIQIICLYNDQGEKTQSWFAEKGKGGCPAFLSEVGTNIKDFTLEVTQKITAKNNYLGLVYLKASMPILRHWTINVLITLVVLCGVALATCFMAAHLGARTITGAIRSVQKQIDCLKQNEVSFCPLSTLNATRETAELAACVVSLRTYLANTTISRETIANVRSWHWEAYAGLLSMVRQHVQADATLLRPLGDYALLMHMERTETAPPSTAFTIAQVLDKSLASARAAHRPDARTNLTASLEADIAPEWLGHPEALSALLHHLLLIGLKRTRHGFVSLRLEIISAIEARHTHTLRLLYEDSGPLIQQWQLLYWLNAPKDEAPPAALGHDISWLLIGRLMRYMGGSITGNAGAAGGMILEAMLPLSLPLALPALTEIASVAEPMQQANKPLVLIVEESDEQRRIIADLFYQAGYRLLMVENHVQAAEMAPILPLSAMVLNASLAESGEDITRRVCNLMENGLLASIPLWVMLDSLSFIEVDYWQQRNVSELLLKPLQPATLLRLCQSLPAPDMYFYARYDTRIRNDLPEKILDAMPAMNDMLAAQVAQVNQLVMEYAAGAEVPKIVEEAHALKSGALTLGYFRLAALMDHIEHAATSRFFTSYPKNWKVIANVLKQVEF